MERVKNGWEVLPAMQHGVRSRGGPEGVDTWHKAAGPVESVDVPKGLQGCWACAGGWEAGGTGRTGDNAQCQCLD